MTTTDHLIDEYLGHLETATRTLPASRRVELLAEIREHITVTLSQSPDQDEATVRTALDRLGAPEDIAREAGADLRPVSPDAGKPVGRRRVGTFEIVAVLLLLVGGIVIPVLGWVAGVVLLWTSARWTTLDKAIGTLVFPGGLTFMAWLVFFWSGSSVCSPDGTCESSGSAGLAMTIALAGAAGSIYSAGYLLHRAARAAT